MTAHETSSPRKSSRYLAALTLGALGVVYGDIGTSPLYAVRECFFGPHGVPLTPENILGVLSLIIWALIVIVTVQYLLIVMRADNRGEGGILALTALLLQHGAEISPKSRRLILLTGIFGTALLFGDGAITPAISVLSAIEGLEVITPRFSGVVVPITVVILLGLFLLQKHGTGRIGSVFGPIIVLWFIVLAALGVRGLLLLDDPSVLLAGLNPLSAVSFFRRNGVGSVIVLGSVFLVVTGAEALFADMGHFGRSAIQRGWFLVVLPGLFLNYLGQCALLLARAGDPDLRNPFYQLAPEWAVFPLVILATCATVIASQALISGAFSLSQQAIQLGFLPRLSISHTSGRQMGQIYVPTINFMLLVVTLILVTEFRSSSALAAAYGISVSGTMVITAVLIFAVANHLWHWPLRASIWILLVFLSANCAFFFANSLKLFDGGWVPIAIAVVIFTIMTTWRRGREILAERLHEHAEPMERFLQVVTSNVLPRVPGTAVFMARDIDRVPTPLVQNVRHNKMLHEKLILLQVHTEERPTVPPEERAQVEKLCENFYALTLSYGFMETADVPEALDNLKIDGTALVLHNITFFLGREIILATDRPGMAIWRERLFAFLAQLALRAPTFYRIPSDQVVEIGTQIEL